MMFKNKIRFALVLASAALASVQTTARPNLNSAGTQKQGLLKTAASCKPATAIIDLDINNVRARLMTGGDMWWDQGTNVAAYEVPKGSRKNSLFAGSCWIGGKDAQGLLKVAAQTYRQDGNDYWPGPLDPVSNDIDASTCSDWDRFWKVNAVDISTSEISTHHKAVAAIMHPVLLMPSGNGLLVVTQKHWVLVK